MLVTGPSTACAIALALLFPLATRTSLRASRMVSMGVGTILDARHQDQLARIENGADAHRDGVHRHVFPALEEARVVIDGLLGERLESGARAQRARRLIEGDVAVGADAQDLQVDPAAFRDTLLVPFAEGGVVAGRPGGNIDVLPRDVHLPEEVLIHEVVVALWMIRGQTDVFVEVERRHAREVDLPRLVQAYQLLIQAEWRGPGRHTEYGIRLGVEHVDDELRRHLAHLLVVALDDDFHASALRFPATRPLERFAPSGVELLTLWSFHPGRETAIHLPLRRDLFLILPVAHR